MRTFLILLTITGCTSVPAPTALVDNSDGVDEREAKLLAREYLQKHMAASLGHAGPFDAGDTWMFRITGDAVPFELPDVPPVFVDKSTGSITWNAKPPLKR